MSDTPLLNGRYQLEKNLGSGGMAVVYRARDLMLERTVAVKLLRADFSNDPDFCEKFKQEARAAANLSHPNIVTVHDFGFDAGSLFIVMEFVPGTDLKSLLRQRGRFPIDEAIYLLTQGCAGVGYAHRAGLIHCDIKPHNLLVSPDQRLKVTDFGIARALATVQPDEQSDVVWGSPQYFSPEQAAGFAPSPASDVYSLGVILYEILTGQLPFIANNAEELARMHREASPIAPRILNPAIPPALEQLVLKVLSKEPSQRYRTADQMGRVLQAISEAIPQTTSLPAQSKNSPGALNPTRLAAPLAAPLATPRATSRAAPLATPRATPLAAVPVRVSTNQAAVTDQPAFSGFAMANPPSVPSRTASTGEDIRPLDFDWLSVFLGLAALLTVGGLIPFWLYIYLTFNPPH